MPASTVAKTKATVGVGEARKTVAATNGTSAKQGLAINHTDAGGHAVTSGITMSSSNPGDGSLQKYSLALTQLTNAAEIMRPLGSHPALVAILRRTARTWVHQWASETAPSKQGMNALRTNGTSTSGQLKTTTVGDAVHGGEEKPLPDLDPWYCLENAAECLAEARMVLSQVVQVAEPTGGVLSTSPVIAQTYAPKPLEGRDMVGDGGLNVAAAGTKGKTSGKGQDKGKKPGGANKGGSPAEVDNGAESKDSLRLSSVEPAAISTPLGRVLTMVQLEEACVRAILCRAKKGNQSERKVKEDAACGEGVTPVDRWVTNLRIFG